MFEIIINRPVKLGKLDTEDTSVSEAIETIYKYDEVGILTIVWNHLSIVLKGHSLASIYNDIIYMLEFIQMGDEKFSITFLDPSFTTKWESELINEDIKITALWTDVDSFGTEKQLLKELRQSNIIVENQHDFIKDWESLLKMIKEDLISTGYDNTLEGFEYLDTL